MVASPLETRGPASPSNETGGDGLPLMRPESYSYQGPNSVSVPPVPADPYQTGNKWYRSTKSSREFVGQGNQRMEARVVALENAISEIREMMKTIMADKSARNGSGTGVGGSTHSLNAGSGTGGDQTDRSGRSGAGGDSRQPSRGPNNQSSEEPSRGPHVETPLESGDPHSGLQANGSDHGETRLDSYRKFSGGIKGHDDSLRGSHALYVDNHLDSHAEFRKDTKVSLDKASGDRRGKYTKVSLGKRRCFRWKPTQRSKDLSRSVLTSQKNRRKEQPRTLRNKVVFPCAAKRGRHPAILFGGMAQSFTHRGRPPDRIACQRRCRKQPTNVRFRIPETQMPRPTWMMLDLGRWVPNRSPRAGHSGSRPPDLSDGLVTRVPFHWGRPPECRQRKVRRAQCRASFELCFQHYLHRGHNSTGARLGRKWRMEELRSITGLQIVLKFRWSTKPENGLVEQQPPQKKFQLTKRNSFTRGNEIEVDDNLVLLLSSSPTVAFTGDGTGKGKYVVKWALDKYVPKGRVIFELLQVCPRMSAILTPQLMDGVYSVCPSTTITQYAVFFFGFYLVAIGTYGNEFVSGAFRGINLMIPSLREKEDRDPSLTCIVFFDNIGAFISSSLVVLIPEEVRWGEFEGGVLELLCERLGGSLLEKCNFRNGIICGGGEMEELSQELMFGLIMIGMGICEMMVAWQLEALIINYLGPSCFTFDGIYVNLSEVLVVGRKVCKNVREAVSRMVRINSNVFGMISHGLLGREVFLSPKQLFKLLSKRGHFQRVLTAIGNCCICPIAVRILFELTVMDTILHCRDKIGSWHRTGKRAPDHKLNHCYCEENIRRNGHVVIDKFAECGLRSLAVARQGVPEKIKERQGVHWQSVGLLLGLLPLFNPSSHDVAETIQRTLNPGINVKMITNDQSKRKKENGREPAGSACGGKPKKKRSRKRKMSWNGINEVKMWQEQIAPILQGPSFKCRDSRLYQPLISLDSIVLGHVGLSCLGMSCRTCSVELFVEVAWVHVIANLVYVGIARLVFDEMGGVWMKLKWVHYYVVQKNVGSIVEKENMSLCDAEVAYVKPLTFSGAPIMEKNGIPNKDGGGIFFHGELGTMLDKMLCIQNMVSQLRVVTRGINLSATAEKCPRIHEKVQMTELEGGFLASTFISTFGYHYIGELMGAIGACGLSCWLLVGSVVIQRGATKVWAAGYRIFLLWNIHTRDHLKVSNVDGQKEKRSEEGKRKEAREKRDCIRKDKGKKESKVEETIKLTVVKVRRVNFATKVRFLLGWVEKMKLKWKGEELPRKENRRKKKSMAFRIWRGKIAKRREKMREAWWKRDKEKMEIVNVDDWILFDAGPEWDMVEKMKAWDHPIALLPFIKEFTVKSTKLIIGKVGLIVYSIFRTITAVQHTFPAIIVIVDKSLEMVGSNEVEIINPTLLVKDLKLLIPVVVKGIIDMFDKWLVMAGSGMVEIEILQWFQNLTEEAINRIEGLAELGTRLGQRPPLLPPPEEAAC